MINPPTFDFYYSTQQAQKNWSDSIADDQISRLVHRYFRGNLFTQIVPQEGKPPRGFTDFVFLGTGTFDECTYCH